MDDPLPDTDSGVESLPDSDDGCHGVPVPKPKARKRRRPDSDGGRPCLPVPTPKRRRFATHSGTPWNTYMSTTTMDVVWPPSILNPDALTNVTTSLLKSNTSLTLSLRSESKLYLMNTTEAPATINAGSALCGFGKVAFRQEGDGVPPFDSHKDVDFSPTSSADHVLLLGANNEMTYETIGRVVAAQSTQASKEKSRICYHELKEVPGDENAFELHQVIRVIARSKPKDQQGAITAASLGGIVSPAVWNTWIVALIFACQWKPTGLMPVRPLVVFKGDVTLKPGQALLLSK